MVLEFELNLDAPTARLADIEVSLHLGPFPLTELIVDVGIDEGLEVVTAHVISSYHLTHVHLAQTETIVDATDSSSLRFLFAVFAEVRRLRLIVGVGLLDLLVLLLLFVLR